MDTPNIRRLQQNLAEYKAEETGAYATIERSNRAGVLIPLVFDTQTDAVHVVLTRRASLLRTHGGEVSLPGGRMEPHDADVTCTALREAHEEIGLDPARAAVLSVHKPAASLHGVLVTPVAASIATPLLYSVQSQTSHSSLTARVIASLSINTLEVESVFTLPLLTFLKNEHHTCKRIFDDSGNLKWMAHSFNCVDEFGREYLVWGLTAHILVRFAVIAYKGFYDSEFDIIPDELRPGVKKPNL
ncbi:hypothetical protein HK100_000853 [Physocladia obscura]|uniref:Nudix hydrolase domain-containing protein n=1 Tax=Physocladia obscura TaxID=109957 RepID=A0AAD5T3S6_9FUNG|nr:hypothetical protein HK100_000853 [Physocladia obscura]